MNTLPIPGLEQPDRTPIVRTPRWQGIVARRTEALAACGRRSFDAYRDVFAPSYDDVLADPDLGAGDTIALVAGFVEHLTGEELVPGPRARLARIVRMHGKAALYGLDQAAARCDDVDAMLRYASVVARAKTTEIADQQGART